MTIIILLSVSLHVAGLWLSKDVSFSTPVGSAFKTYTLNWVSVTLFVVTMGVVAYMNKALLAFPTTFGAVLYIWWVVSTFLVLTLTHPEELSLAAPSPLVVSS